MALVRVAERLDELPADDPGPALVHSLHQPIAEQLQISRRTVETHRARILHKLDAHSAVDLVRLAASLGLLPADSAA